MGVRNHFFLLCCHLSLRHLFIWSQKEQAQKALSGILCTEQRGHCEEWDFIRGVPGLADLPLDHPDPGKEATAIGCCSVHSKSRKTHAVQFPWACLNCWSLHRPGRNPSLRASVWTLLHIVNPFCHCNLSFFYPLRQHFN